VHLACRRRRTHEKSPRPALATAECVVCTNTMRAAVGCGFFAALRWHGTCGLSGVGVCPGRTSFVSSSERFIDVNVPVRTMLQQFIEQRGRETGAWHGSINPPHS
jgi:hypothetical protein